MNWTVDDVKRYVQKRLRDEQRTRTKLYAKNHPAPEGLPANEPECAQGGALVCDAPRKETCGVGPASRITIRFIVRSRRPMDWDNICGKYIQDLVVKNLGIAPDDGWQFLQGHVTSEKADSAEDEGTTIIVEQL